MTTTPSPAPPNIAVPRNAGAARAGSSWLRLAARSLLLVAVIALSGAARSEVSQPTFANPGFETGTSIFAKLPASWAGLRDPVWLRGSEHAHTGTGALHVSDSAWLLQSIPGMAGRTHVTVTGFARTGYEGFQGAIRCHFDRTPIVPNFDDVPFAADADWTEFAAPLTIHPTATRANIYFRARFGGTWVALDDLGLLVEWTKNPGFETVSGGGDSPAPQDWTPLGAARFDDSSARARTGSVAVLAEEIAGWTQEFAARDDAQTYLLTFFARADAVAATTATLRLDWRGRDRAVIASDPLPCNATPAGWSLHSFALRPPADAASATLVLALEPTADPDAPAPAPLWIDDVAWGWVGAYPAVCTPNADGIDDAAKPFVWWPDAPATPPAATVSTSDESLSASLTFTASSEGAPGLWESTWNGADASGAAFPPGGANARLTLRTADGTAFTLALPGLLRRENVAPAPPTLPPAPPTQGFILGAWTYMAGAWARADYAELLRQVRADGIDWALASPAPSRYPELRDAATSTGTHLITYCWDCEAQARGNWSNRARHEALMREANERLLAEGVPRNSLAGAVYLCDEPLESATARLANRLMRIHASLAPDLRSLATLNTSIDWRTRMRELDPATYMLSSAPFNTAATSQTDALYAWARTMDEFAAFADADARPAWIIGQGYSMLDNMEPPSPAAYRGQVWASVVVGARAFIPFLHFSSSSLEGLRHYDGSQTPRARESAALSPRVAALDSYLRAHRPDRLAPQPAAAPPLLAKLWQPVDAIGAPAAPSRDLWIVNCDTESTRLLQISMQGADFLGAGDAPPHAPLLGPGEAIRLALSAVPSSLSINSTRQAAAPGPIPLLTAPAPLAVLPIPLAQQIHRIVADPVHPRVIALSATSFASGGGAFLIDLTSPRAPSLKQRLSAVFAQGAAFSGDGTALALCDGARGFQSYRIQEWNSGGATTFSAALVGQVARPQGNAIDALPDPADPDRWWVSRGIFGMDRLEFPAQPPPQPLPTLERTGGAEFAPFPYMQNSAWLDTPAAPGSPNLRRIASVDPYSGLYLLDVNADTGETTPVAQQFQYLAVDLVALADQRTLAVAHQEQGLALFDTFTLEPPQIVPWFTASPPRPAIRRTANIPALSTITGLARLGDHVLVISDGRAAVRFFDVADPSSPREILRLRPFAEPAPWIDSLAVSGDLLLVAGRARGVVVLDAAAILARLGLAGWVAQ